MSETEEVTFTVTITVPTRLKGNAIDNLEYAISRYVSTMSFVEKATIKREESKK